MVKVQVLGVDPGLAVTGWALVSAGDGHGPKLVEYGLVKTSPPAPVRARMDRVADGVLQIAAKHDPSAIVVEDFVFYNKRMTNTKQGHEMAQLIETLRLTVRALGIPFVPFPNGDWKKLLLGIRSANKTQVKIAVQSALGYGHFRSVGIPVISDGGGHIHDAAGVALAYLIREGKWKNPAVLPKKAGLRLRVDET